MHKDSRRVVVTGLGAVSPVGIGHKEMWQALLSGASGVSRVSHFDPDEAGLEVKIAAEVKGFDIANFYSDRRQVGSMLKEMDRVTLFAVAAAKMALDDARLEIRGMQRPERAGTFIGTGVGGLNTTIADYAKLVESGPRKIGLRSIIRLMPNAPSGQVAILHGAKGRAKGEATACASGLDSIFDAYMYIKSNRADVMIAGGTEASLNPLAFASFGNMMALSKRNESPMTASRPFSVDRDGFVMGEGAAVLVLEDLAHAINRGAQIYAEIVGGGATCDAVHIVAPDEQGAGAARAIREALDDACLEPQQIQYINAHGTSTPLNDARETLAIKSVFGEHAHKLQISSTKSMIGHLLGAAGAIGATVAALSIKEQKIHPTINLHNPDPECDLDYVPHNARDASIDNALVEALGFGGHNTALVMSKFRA